MDCQKHLFSLPEDEHYINCAYFSPLLKSVEEAGLKGMRAKREPWHISSQDFFTGGHRLRELYARLINAEDPQRIALLTAASYGLSTVARNLPREGVSGKKIIVAGEQFPSNVYPWMRFCRENGCRLEIVEALKEATGRGEKWNAKILDAIGSDTLMVALGNIHWADGTLFDLEAIGQKAREHDAFFVIDGTQSIGALPFDQQKVKADAVISAGYKWLMGPYTLAMGYFGPRFDGGVPLEEGWLKRKNSEDFAGLVNYEDNYQPGAIRYDMGESSNFIGVPMMIAALEQILEWDPADIQEYCKTLTQNLVKELPKLGYTIEDPEWRSHHLFGIRLPEQIKPKELSDRLKDRKIHISVRGSAIRISPNVYNTEDDMQALLEVLKESV